MAFSVALKVEIAITKSSHRPVKRFGGILFIQVEERGREGSL